MSLLEISDGYQYFIDGKPSGYLKIEHSPENYRNFEYDFQITTDERLELSIITVYDNGISFGLIKHSVFNKNNEEFIVDASFWEDNPDNTIPDGVIRAKEGERIITSLPENTVTDLMLFEIVKKLPFEKETVLTVNVLEACEMNLKKRHTLIYKELNKGQHLFVEVDKDKNIAARYWLDDNHRLQQVRWGTDKEFILSEGN